VATLFAFRDHCHVSFDALNLCLCNIKVPNILLYAGCAAVLVLLIVAAVQFACFFPPLRDAVCVGPLGGTASPSQ
jgi:hypothetical protein